jgi:5'-3' exonuclease
MTTGVRSGGSTSSPRYKTHRVAEVVADDTDIEEVPDPLTAQIPVIRDELAVLGIPVVGRADHEADDVIASYATQHAGAVDVVTGDRDLFQLVDDARSVRVIYTGRGMSKLEVLDEAAVVEKYGVRASQYSDFAVLRGDASDGLPGVAGIGEKTAAALLASHGDLAGIIAEAARGGLAAGVRAKIVAATDYLAVAPPVVEVVRTLDLPPSAHRCVPDPDGRPAGCRVEPRGTARARSPPSPPAPDDQRAGPSRSGRAATS